MLVLVSRTYNRWKAYHFITYFVGFTHVSYLCHIINLKQGNEGMLELYFTRKLQYCGKRIVYRLPLECLRSFWIKCINYFNSLANSILACVFSRLSSLTFENCAYCVDLMITSWTTNSTGNVSEKTSSNNRFLYINVIFISFSIIIIVIYRRISHHGDMDYSSKDVS